VKYLGLPRVGLLSLIWVVVGYFSIMDFGLGQALTKTVAEAIAARDPDKVARLYGTATRIQLVMGLVGGLIMAASARYLVSSVLRVPAPLQPEAQLSVILCAIAFPRIQSDDQAGSGRGRAQVC
jgi:Na+-driven multidrug efflux pump